MAQLVRSMTQIFTDEFQLPSIPALRKSMPSEAPSNGCVICKSAELAVPSVYVKKGLAAVKESGVCTAEDVPDESWSSTHNQTVSFNVVVRSITGKPI